jgi:hypothetical protein
MVMMLERPAFDPLVSDFTCCRVRSRGAIIYALISDTLRSLVHVLIELEGHTGSMRRNILWLVILVSALGIAGCGGSLGQSNSRPRATTDQATGDIGAVPGTLPSRLCTSSIYSGPNASAVVRTPDDVVVGPVRFGTLKQATGKAIYSFRSSGRPYFGFKSPLTIAGTSSRWIAVRVSGDRGEVKIGYDPFGIGSPEGATGYADVAAMESGVACGRAPVGFVQYNGGFTWQHPTCATIQVFDELGHLLGSKTVPFGKKACT